MRTNSKKQRQARRRRFRTSKVIAAICLGSALFYFGTTLILRSYSNSLSVTNQQLANDIEQRSAAIEELKSEIATLQEKNRVLGMLEGQVSEDSNNVYYYGND